MNAEEQQNAEQGVRDWIDHFVEEHHQEGRNTEWTLKASAAHHNRAPNACHPNQTALQHRDGSRYLVTVTMLRAPVERKGGVKNANRQDTR